MQNAYGQPIGPAVPGWTPRPLPPRSPMPGMFCHVVPLDFERHADDLYIALCESPQNWTYLPFEPPSTREAFDVYLKNFASGADPLAHAIVDAHTGKALGVAAYLRIDRNNGSIEVGHLHFGSQLARKAAATEAMYLMMARAFEELGYRRYEWKCDALNAPSRAAALRLGFTYEGIFRQAVVYKGRSRDTAWFSITHGEWPRVRAALERWLHADNFDAAGTQRMSLSAIREQIPAGA